MGGSPLETIFWHFLRVHLFKRQRRSQLVPLFKTEIATLCVRSTSQSTDIAFFIKVIKRVYRNEVSLSQAVLRVGRDESRVWVPGRPREV